MAASTHDGEEALIAATVRALGQRPLLVLVPRHPERGPEVARDLRAAGWRVALRSAGEPVVNAVDAYVADTLGELGLFYRLAAVVVMGGSLVEGLSGHNPLEPARLGKAVVSGPHVASFERAYHDLLAAKAVLVALDGPALHTALAALLGEPEAARTLGARAAAVAGEGEAAFDQAWAALTALVPPR